MDPEGLEPAPAPEAASPEAEEPTLPEVVVQPSEEPAPSPVPSAGPSSPYDLPLSCPSLSDIEFEGFGSALRSTRSIFDDPRHTTVIDSNDLRERNARDMHEALEREVGVIIQRTGASHASPFIRGLTGPQTLILVDGVRLNNSTFRFGPNQYFATIDPGMIERIEVVRGPQSVLWGSDAIGGVINVVTRSAERGFGNFRGGEFIERFSTADSGSYSRVNVEGRINRGGVFTGASYLNIRDIDRGGGLGRQEMTNYSQYAGDIKFDYLLGDNQLLTVSLQHLEQEDVPRTDKWFHPTKKELRIFDPQQRDLAYIRWQGTNPGGPVDAFMLTFSFGRQKEGTFKHRLSRSYFNLQQFDAETTGMNLVLASELGFLGRLTYGVDLYHDEIDAWNNRFDFATGAFLQADTPQYPTDSYYERAGAFLQWDVDVTDRLYAVAGVRYTNIELGATVAMFDPTDPGFPNVDPVPTPMQPNFQDWTGSVGLTYEVNPCLHLVGSVSEGFRAPLLDELTSVSDNVGEGGVDLPVAGLSPETSYNYEVGLKFDYERIHAQTFVFWTQLEGLIDRVVVFHDPVEDIDYYQRLNVGQAELQGVELAGELLLTPSWSAYGNLTYTYGQNVTVDEPLSRIPPTQGIIGFRWRDREARNFFDIYAWLVTKQDRLSSRDQRDTVRIPPGGTPGYATVNLRLGSYIGRNQRVTLGIENIFDRYYRVHGSGVDGPGISGVFAYELFY